MKPLPTYLDSSSNCKKLLVGQHVLFDANVLISLLDDYSTDFLDFLQSINVTFTTIHPVLVEMQRTNSAAKRAKRSSMLIKYNFTILPLTRVEFDKSRDIQNWLSAKDCFPEPTDLYLGGTVSKYGKNIYLATCNLTDFPYPLFTRECFAIIQNNKHANLISFLKIDNTQLVAFS
ncbi:MAG TPA: hypothetical protein VLB73_01550 [Patescibacteria group bacterium]|nr:hypothetical protein [Patescibacteria group bacterium]